MDMSGDVQKVTLNGAKWPMAIVLALILNFAGVVWGASQLSTRVGVIEKAQATVEIRYERLADTVSLRGQTIAVMGEKIDRIDKNVQRLLDQ